MPEIHPAYEGFAQNYQVDGRVVKGGLVPPSATKIIMGTFPPPSVMSRVVEGNPFFYYNSPRNHFWNRIESFAARENNIRWKWLNSDFETEQENVNQKIQLAIQKGWAYMDFFARVDRIVENNADDANLIDIENVVRNGQLIAALNLVTTLTKIFCTYTTALTGLLNALNVAGYVVNQSPEERAANGVKYNLNFRGRLIEIVLLYPASRSGHPARVKDAQYSHYLT